MTDKQRLAALRRAIRHLKNTTRGYDDYKRTGSGSEWRAALRDLETLELDLLPRTNVPALGPIVAGGKSVLDHDCTHITSDLGWPAFDDGWVTGKAVIAPENLVVYDDTSGAQGGDAFYVRGDSGLLYWVGHITTVPKQGTRFRKGQRMTAISSDHPRPHVHLGIDARPLIGRHLTSKTNYTHGAPKIGTQLAAALDV